jgi:hypothetical protein
MAIPLFIGLFAEGTTDNRFLENIILNTIRHLQYECHTEIEIYDDNINNLEVSKRTSFVEKVLEASKKGLNEFGMNILFVHTDADDKTLAGTYRNKINPALKEMSKMDTKEYCQTIIPIIPIREIEAWLLADKELFKKQLDTTKSDNDLKINKKPEIFTHPKETIEEAIRIVSQDKTKKRKKELTISDLYEPIGIEISLDKLRELSSFQKFEEEVRGAFKNLDYLAP